MSWWYGILTAETSVNVCWAFVHCQQGSVQQPLFCVQPSIIPMQGVSIFTVKNVTTIKSD